MGRQHPWQLDAFAWAQSNQFHSTWRAVRHAEGRVHFGREHTYVWIGIYERCARIRRTPCAGNLGGEECGRGSRVLAVSAGWNRVSDLCFPGVARVCAGKTGRKQRVQISYGEGVVNDAGLASCTAYREVRVEALASVCTGQRFSREITLFED